MSLNSAKTVCVFCGAGGKMSLAHKANAYALGEQLANNGFNLLTGGANVGMMKEVVDGHASVKTNVSRHGVMPTVFKNFEISHSDIPVDNMIWSQDIHGRLKKFYEICDDIVVLPGGFGTMHELMDCLVHSQFGMIKKRIYLLNINNFWDSTIAQFKIMVSEKAVPQKHVDHLIVVKTVQDLLVQLKLEVEAELIQGIEAERWDTDN